MKAVDLTGAFNAQASNLAGVGTTRKRRLVQKLGYGQGSIYTAAAADGTTVYIHIYSDDGRQREVRLKATNLTAARKEAAARNTKRDSGALPSPSRRTVGEVANEFFTLEHSLVDAGELRARTFDLYRQRYRSHSRPSSLRRPSRRSPAPTSPR